MGESNNSEWSSSHQVNLLQEIISIVFLECFNGTSLLADLSGQWENSTWGTFDMDVDHTITLVNSASSVEQSSTGGSQWNGGDHNGWVVSSEDLSVDWNVSVLQEFQKSNFGVVTNWNELSLSHLDIGSIVIENSLLQKFDG
jgi:hypothetical protein